METNPISFKRDLSLEVKFTKTIKAILGNFFFQKDVIQDLTQATDFLVFNVKPVKVAVRLRRYKYFLKYPLEFTIRYRRPSGVKTEFQKILEGSVDYLFYGFLNEDETKIIQYFIADLEKFRQKNPSPIALLSNYPHDSDLAAYNLTQFPKEFVKKFYPA